MATFGKAPRNVERDVDVRSAPYRKIEPPLSSPEVREVLTTDDAEAPIDYMLSPHEKLKAHMREVAIASGDVKFFTRREIAYLPEMMSEGEEIIRFASGLIGANTWLISLTNKRIIFLNVGMIYGVEHKSIYLDKITAVSGKEGLLLGKIFIRDGAGEHIIEGVQKATVPNFVKAAQNAIVQHREKQHVAPVATGTGGRYDTIEKLFRLKEMGAITAEEFEKEKARIL